MSVGLYMDVHVRREVTEGLRARGVDVLTAHDDNAAEFGDPELLDRATEIGRVLFSQDEDLLAEAASRQRSGNHFAGVVYARQLGITIGQCIDDLELIAGVYEPDEMVDRLISLPAIAIATAPVSVPPTPPPAPASSPAPGN